MHMYKHTFTQVHPYTYKYTYICTYTCMYAHTHIYIYIYISQHVDLSNINALCLGGGTYHTFMVWGRGSLQIKPVVRGSVAFFWGGG